MMSLRKSLLLLLFSCAGYLVHAQCGGQIMEPGFAFLSSSRGCAPFTVQIETLYLSSTVGTQYHVDWGDGSPQELFTQTNATGVIISHNFPNSPIDCGYNVTIDAENACNPLGSVVPITTQVVVWTNDVISMAPALYRVCAGYAASLTFTDDSDWNCYPRPTRENNEARWIQWIYGTGPAVNQMAGVQVNGVAPGAFPYLNPAPNTNPIYPVLAPGQVSLPIDVPVTTPADVGKEFELTLKNWNQCNPYDNILMDGNPRNPVTGDLVNGDNLPQVVTGRIVIVESPQAQFTTRLGGSAGPIQNVFCVEDDIFFDDLTPVIAGSVYSHRWDFFDNPTGAGAPLFTRTSQQPTESYTTTGQKLIRLTIRDLNAAGNCSSVFELVITISPSLVAQIGVTTTAGAPITPDFCQSPSAPFETFVARFSDVSVGTIVPSTIWRWEFYDQNNVLVRSEPAGPGYSSTQLGPFDQSFTALGTYRVVLRIRDNLTSCESSSETFVHVYEKPQPEFTFTTACEGTATVLTDVSVITNPIGGQTITVVEWDLDYDGTSFSKDPALDGLSTVNHIFPGAGTYPVALRVATTPGGCPEIRRHDVVVNPLPTASFTPDRTTGCSTLSINFTNNSIAGQPDLIKEYRWEIDAGAGFVVDSVQQPSDPGFSNIFTRDFVNTSSGNIIYAVRLRVITVNDCELVSAPSDITVFPGPTSGFISVNYSPFNDNCSPVSVDFTVDSQTQSLSPSDYLWTISDASGIVDQISTGTTPGFTYNFVNDTQAMKDFSVSLRALLASGCYGDSIRTIRVSPVPVSDFTIDTLQFDCQRMRLKFEAVQKGLSEYNWEIVSNGVTLFSSTTVGDILEYEIASAAVSQSVDITLITTNLANCQSLPTVENVVVPQYNNMNTSFTATPPVQTLPNATVTLNNTTNTGPWTYLWDFGDGTTSTNPAIGSHTYATFGTYTISLTVMDGACTEQQTATITINPIPPVVDFAYDPPSGCAPLTVTFTNLSQYADPSSYFWSFGENEGNSRQENPMHTYYEPGVYSVTLSASNVTGDTTEITKHFIIEVYALPEAEFNIKPRVVYLPGGRLSTRNESLGATQFQWDFGDGGTSTSVEPEHIYTTPGIYTVTLVAINAQQCADTARMEAGVRVEDGGQLLIPNAFSPNLSGPGGNLDGNDVFLPLMRGVVDFHMMVFNRWGQMLFETKTAEQGWDGYFQGKLCQQDVYVYKIVAKYADGNVITKVGDIHLIR